MLLRWGLQRGFVVIPKSTHPERIAANLAPGQGSVTLDAEDMTAMNQWDGYEPTGWDPSNDE